jgi:transcription initiation factor TFIID TATA-box-binding protein
MAAQSKLANLDVRPCNVVASGRLGCTINLQKLCLSLWNTEYRPSRFNGLTLRIRSPKATGLIFSSGSIVVLGTNSVLSASIAMRKMSKLIRKAGFPVALTKFKVGNQVCSVSLRSKLDLNRIAVSSNAVYEPEIFSGLKLKTKSGTVIAFSSGKLIVTGCKTKAEQTLALEEFLSVYTRE